MMERDWMPPLRSLYEFLVASDDERDAIGRLGHAHRQLTEILLVPSTEHDIHVRLEQARALIDHVVPIASTGPPV